MGSRLEKNSNEVRKRIENHTFAGEDGEEYASSKFGGFGDYFRRKKIKLQNLDAELRSQSTDRPQIFRGIVCHVNGYTQPSLNDLHVMIVSHGGGFIQYLDNKTMVTHIVASSLTPKKAEEFKRYRIVKPAWIAESVAAGKLLPWHNYRVVDEGVTQKVLEFDSGKLASRVNQKQLGYRDQTDASWYTSQLSKIENKAAPQIEDAGNSSPSQGSPRDAETGEKILPKAPDLDEQCERDGWDDDIPEPPVTDSATGHSTALAPDGDSLLDDEHMDGSESDEIPSVNGAESAPDEHMDETTVSGVPKRKDSPCDEYPPAKRQLTAEEHNAILLSDPKIRNSSVLNPNFLEQYYRESRLHHLSTWKADLKSQIQSLTASRTASQRARLHQPPNARRYIMHVDFDSFFVAVSLKSNPGFVDKPACVAHGPGPNSEIASCNYPAREFGVKNGMWMKRAHELCPDLKVLPYDFPGYEAASREFYDAILATGGVVQSVSIDEALVDITLICHVAGGTDGKGVREGGTKREQEKADEIAQKLRDEMKERTGCAVSIGIGNNILLAKVALRKAKPAGQCQIKPEDALEFVGHLEARELPGVAWSISRKLEEIGIKYVKDIRDVTREKLIYALGPKTGEKLWNYSRGIDKTEVGEEVIRKSVSAEVNWGVRFETQEQAEEFVESLCGEVQRRLMKEGVKGKQMTMKIMRRAADAPLDPQKHLGHGKCDTFSKSVILGVATTDKGAFAREAISILRSYGFSPGELRGLGVQVTKLEPLKGGAGESGSQRRLQFQNATATKADPTAAEDDIEDGPETPRKPKSWQRPPAPGADQKDSPSKKPLNTLGTQFIMPTQVDQDVLAELPEDIRTKLTRSLQERVPSKQDETPSARVVEYPSETQLDPSALEALPVEMREEILAHYRSAPKEPRPAQSVLPQSPRKALKHPPLKKAPARGRPKPRSILSRTREAAGSATLTQSNFVAAQRRVIKGLDDATNSDDSPGDIPDEFLEALPEDIRQEVLAQHRAEHLKRTAGLEVQKNQRNRGQALEQSDEQIERTIIFPAKSERPSFTSAKLSTLDELRSSVSQWFAEFWDDGPYDEDTEALGRYLRKVIADEGDMNKAVQVVRWLQWVMEERGGGLRTESMQKWLGANKRLQDGINQALKDRGAAPVYFG